MAVPVPRWRCEVAGCGREKQEANHWYVVCLGRPGHVVVMEWDDDFARGSNAHVACGRGHAHILIDKYLDEKNTGKGGNGKTGE